MRADAALNTRPSSDELPIATRNSQSQPPSLHLAMSESRITRSKARVHPRDSRVQLQPSTAARADSDDEHEAQHQTASSSAGVTGRQSMHRWLSKRRRLEEEKERPEEESEVRAAQVLQSLLLRLPQCRLTLPQPYHPQQPLRLIPPASSLLHSDATPLVSVSSSHSWASCGSLPPLHSCVVNGWLQPICRLHGHPDRQVKSSSSSWRMDRSGVAEFYAASIATTPTQTLSPAASCCAV